MLSITIVISSYVRPDELKRCVAGLTPQLLAQDDILVVAKAWDEKTQLVVGNLPSVRVVTVDRVDIATAVNFGIQSATGDIVAFIDDDAVPRDGWLSAIRKRYSDPSVGAVGGRDHLYLDGELVDDPPTDAVGRITWYGAVLGNHHRGYGPVRPVDVLKGCNMSIRRACDVRISERLLGPYNYRWEDDLCAQIKSSGAKVLYDPEIAVIHHSKRSSHDRRPDPDILFASAHNLAYVQFLHLSPFKRMIWLLFSIVVGQPDDPGLLRLSAPLINWLTAVRGKISGVRAARTELIVRTHRA